MLLRLQAPIYDPTLADLPPVPADPLDEGRHVSWVEAVRAPGFHHGAEYVAVDEDWIDQRIANFAALLESKPGWLAPVLVAHHDNGENEGHMFELRRWILDGVPVMLAAVAWSDPEAEAKIKSHRLTHVSIAIDTLQRSDTGEYLEAVPYEISKTSIPHLGMSRVLNTATGGNQMSDQSTPTKVEASAEDAATLRGRIEELIAQNARLSAELEAIKAMQDNAPEMEDEDKEEEPAEMTALRARVADLEAKAQAAELSAHKANVRSAYRGGSLTLTADLMDALAEASHGNDALLNVIDAAYVEAAPSEQPKHVAATIPEVLRKRLSAADASAPAVQQVPTTIEECDMLAEAEAAGDMKLKAELYHKHLKAMEARR